MRKRSFLRILSSLSVAISANVSADAAAGSDSSRSNSSLVVSTVDVRFDDSPNTTTLFLNSSFLVRPNCLMLCAHFDMADSHCEELIRYSEDRYENDPNLVEGGLTRGPEPPKPPPPYQMLPYNPSLLPSYLSPFHEQFRPPRPPRTLSTVSTVSTVSPPEFSLPDTGLGRALALHHVSAAIKYTHSSLPPQTVPSLLNYLTSNLPYTSECILISISKSNAIFVNSPNSERYVRESWWRTRRRVAVLDLLLSLSKTTKLPETSFIFCPTDCVGANYRASSSGYPKHYGGLDPKDNPPPPGVDEEIIHPPPIFSQITCAETNVLPFPIFGARGKNDPRFENFDWFTNLFSATNGTKINKAVFRGQVEGKTCWSGDPNEAMGKASISECGRRKLLLMGSYYDDMMDFDFASDVDSSNYIPLQQQSSYAANVVLEGHCGWSDRLRYILFMDTVCVKQRSYCEEWFEGLMVPWVHYVPVSYMLDSLPAALEYVLSFASSSWVSGVKRNARIYGQDAVSQKGIGEYVEKVLEEYNEAFMDMSDNQGSCDETCDGFVRAEKYLGG